MLWILIGLSALSFLLLLVGFVWVLVQRGDTTHTRGEEVGREIAAERMEEDDETTLAQATAFRGQAVSVRTEATVSFGEIKSQVRSGQWRQALPALLAMGGLLGLILFGSLAILVAMDDKLIGGFVALVGVFATLRVLFALIRA